MISNLYISWNIATDGHGRVVHGGGGNARQSNDTLSGTVKYVKYKTIGIIDE
jgi:hypothetical protein